MTSALFDVTLSCLEDSYQDPKDVLIVPCCWQVIVSVSFPELAGKIFPSPILESR